MHGKSSAGNSDLAAAENPLFLLAAGVINLGLHFRGLLYLTSTVAASSNLQKSAKQPL
jgi:hypothetical protein